MEVATDKPIRHSNHRSKDDKERRERYLAAQKRYGHKDYFCTICNITIKQSGKTRHEKTKKHSSNSGNNSIK